MAIIADKTAVDTPLATFNAQLGLAPSQIIPVRLAIMFWTAEATCGKPPPMSQVIPQLEPVAATTQPHKADNRPKLCLM